jgi:hypothetical protein
MTDVNRDLVEQIFHGALFKAELGVKLISTGRISTRTFSVE